jgi:hypothetical protein
MKAAIGTVTLAVIVIATLWRLNAASVSQMLGTDEADYVRAARYGSLAHYMASQERSGTAMLLEVIAGVRSGASPRPFNRDWDADDAAGLRHYHPPLALYPVAALARRGVTSEAGLRLPGVVYGILAALASALLAWRLLAAVPQGVQAAMAAAAGLLTASSPYHVLASTEIGPHALFSLLSTLVLAALTEAAWTGSRRWWLLACAVAGLTLLTVPYWALLVPPVLWVWWRGRPLNPRPWRTLGWGAVVAGAAATVAWPPFLLEAAFVKPILMYVGIVLEPLGSRPPGQWVLNFSSSHRLFAAMTLGGIAAFPVHDQRTRARAIPALLFVMSFVLVNLRVGHMKPLYVADVVPALAAVAAGGVGALIVYAARIRRFNAGMASTALAAAVVVAAAPPIMNAPTRQWHERLDQLGRQFESDRVLVTPRAAGAILKYYLPHTTIVLDSNHPADVPDLERQIGGGDLRAVIRWGNLTEPGGPAAAVTKARPADGHLDTGSGVAWWWYLDGLSSPTRAMR